MTNLSININKIAWLRNARDGDVPNLVDLTNKIIKSGCHGITVHPRPDLRHITPKDVSEIKKIIPSNIEFNIEGNPFSKPNKDFLGFCELVELTNPDQITLVPDEINQITSDHGWLSGIHDNDLKNIIKSLKDSSNSNISLFIDNKDGVEYASVMGANLIEIHTGKFSKGIEENELSVVTEIQEIIDCALDSNLLVNAGHDLNLNNLHYLVEMGNINEVSIGHAIIIDSLHYGFEETISKYLDIIRN